jgi:D-glycero-alpha-D-manno-heptose-7-phosphate kinase
MIIARIPFRISLGGGSTDLPSYYRKYEGALVTASVNKYMYVVLNQSQIDDKIRLYYRYTEIHGINELDKIEHNIIRETLKLHKISQALEIGSFAEIPAQTGMGSSSVFTVGLITALNSLQHIYMSPKEVAEEACAVEIELVGKPIGKQDQYASAIGGINELLIDKLGKVTVNPLGLHPDTIFELENRLLMFYTGITRDANEILGEQSQKAKDNEQQATEAMHQIKALGREVKTALLTGDIDLFGMILNSHWEIKKRISGKMSNPQTDQLYSLALENGAIGGKLIGAGGGGFLLLCAKEGGRKPLKQTMESLGLKYMDFRFEFEGAKIIANY